MCVCEWVFTSACQTEQAPLGSNEGHRGISSSRPLWGDDHCCKLGNLIRNTQAASQAGCTPHHHHPELSNAQDHSFHIHPSSPSAPCKISSLEPQNPRQAVTCCGGWVGGDSSSRHFSGWLSCIPQWKPVHPSRGCNLLFNPQVTLSSAPADRQVLVPLRGP